MKTLRKLNSILSVLSSLNMIFLAVATLLATLFVITQTFYYECMFLLNVSLIMAVLQLLYEVASVVTKYFLSRT